MAEVLWTPNSVVFEIPIVLQPQPVIVNLEGIRAYIIGDFLLCQSYIASRYNIEARSVFVSWKIRDLIQVNGRQGLMACACYLQPDKALVWAPLFLPGY